MIGPNADADAMQNGNYAGRASAPRRSSTASRRPWAKTPTLSTSKAVVAPVVKNKSDPAHPTWAQKAIAAAKSADLIIFVSGIDAGLRRKKPARATDDYEGFSRGDRTRIELPQVQEDLIQRFMRPASRWCW